MKINANLSIRADLELILGKQNEKDYYRYSVALGNHRTWVFPLFKFNLARECLRQHF